MIGEAEEEKGDYEAAVGVFEEALGILTPTGQPAARAIPLNYLSRLRWRQGRYAEAAQLAQEGLRFSISL